MTELLIRARRAVARCDLVLCRAPGDVCARVPPELVRDLALGENEEKVKAIAALCCLGRRRRSAAVAVAAER